MSTASPFLSKKPQGDPLTPDHCLTSLQSPQALSYLPSPITLFPYFLSSGDPFPHLGPAHLALACGAVEAQVLGLKATVKTLAV